ncbi:hypothetical protein L207DRAFT_75470 [Hyaloscypha variabilis F]|uniref:Uncharacterized protein n=1 Tax=Hyaloscypha variabilis (strain UAMH 11265 / GT02V1 / F) TaxID=1149755 RepID=A0A2J6RFV4_HYAVF|nr:hypothetical protein L207DRAFT_75470 [Hyaloscypha variabilis F]
MKSEICSTASEGDDCPSTSSLLDECISRICTKCISSVVIADPASLQGQQEGAILVIKSNTICQSEEEDEVQPQVGDHVMVIRFEGAKQVIVRNLRGYLQTPVPWTNFFPVPYSGKCACLQGRCRCIYESEETFYERCPHDSDKTANLDLETADPDTRRGQSVGAVLTVKHNPCYPTDIGPILQTEIGDKVLVLRHFRKDSSQLSMVKGKNLRTGGEGLIGWKAFRALGARMMCGCTRAKCNCVYDDFEASMEHKERVGRAQIGECEAVSE